MCKKILNKYYNLIKKDLSRIQPILFHFCKHFFIFHEFKLVDNLLHKSWKIMPQHHYFLTKHFKRTWSWKISFVLCYIEVILKQSELIQDFLCLKALLIDVKYSFNLLLLVCTYKFFYSLLICLKLAIICRGYSAVVARSLCM